MNRATMSLNFTPFERKIVWVLFTVLLSFLVVRAIYVPVLHDELATFFYYIQTDNYLPPKAHWDANNHILNSMLANWSYHLFGSSPLSLRLPNVLAYGLFLFGTFQLAGRLRSTLIRWGFLLALVGSHYLFEYFGECRGYGMSMAFFVMALYYFFRLRETNRIIYIIGVAFFLFIGTAANLTLIIPSVLLFTTLALYAISKNRKTSLLAVLKDLGIVLLAGIPFLLLAKQSFILKDRGALYYGGDSGFYDITVQSVTKVFTDFYSTPIAVLITLITLGILSYLIYKIIRKRSVSEILEPAGFFSYLFLASIVCILFVSYQLEVNFPEDRAAMHLFILFIASFSFVIDQLADYSKKLVFAAIPLFYFPVLFLFHATPTGSVFSSEERTPYPLYQYVQNTPTNFKFPQLVGGYKTQEFCWYYLSNREGGTSGKIHTNYHIALDADFQVVRDGKITDSILFDYYTPVISDPATHLTLFERKKPLTKTLIYSVAVTPTNGNTTDEFHNILELKIDSLRNKTLYIGAEMTLFAEAKPFVSWLAVTINDRDGQSLYQEYIALDWLRKDYDGSLNNVLQGTLLHNIPAEADHLKFYIWNIDKTSFSIPNGKCYLYDLERDFPTQY